jgi:cation:H+ antiporter
MFKIDNERLLKCGEYVGYSFETMEQLFSYVKDEISWLESHNKNYNKKQYYAISTLKDICFIILGIAALKFGGDLAVDNAVKVATILGLSEKIISVTILAIGTSLPELVTSVSAAAKGKSDIAVGNILGSNIFNMLLIIGTSALIKPIVYNMSYNKDLIILLAGTLVLALFPLIPPKNEMSRMNGVIYVRMYAGYIASLLFI